MAKTKINWADKVWNPVTGCTPAGVGCQHCYARRMWPRLASMSPKYAGRAFGDVKCHTKVLGEPTHWRKPQAVFVNSMGDLFHEEVPESFMRDVFTRMGMSNRHTYIVLTKRPERMRNFCINAWGGCPENVVLGVSCSTQAEVDRMVPVLLGTPAAKRVVSLEPLVEPVSLRRGPATFDLDGVIVGGESGPGAREIQGSWVRDLRDECAGARVPFHFKQWGDNVHPLDYEEPYGGVCAVYTHPHNGRMLDGRTHDELCWEVGS
jgi:protein gp37